MRSSTSAQRLTQSGPIQERTQGEFLQFSSVLSMKQLFCRQLSLPESGTFSGVVLPKGRSRNCLRVRMRERGWGVVWGCGWDSAVQPHSMGGVRGGRGGTHTGTHTHTQERARELATYPLKSARQKHAFPLVRMSSSPKMLALDGCFST